MTVKRLKNAEALFASFGIPEDEKILIGLSGGCDSTALFLFLLEKAGKERLAVLHVNHGIRGEEAEKDEAFCRELAERAGVPFAAVARDIPAEAKEAGKGVEETARDVRYALYREAAARFGCRYAALGHNRDDFTETFFFRLIRGTGTRGLASIPAVRREGELTVVRPLLSTGRDELREYLESRGQNWREDSTNRDPSYARNRLRLRILPEMKKINPALGEETELLAEELREEEEFLTALADRAYETAVDGDGLSVEALRKTEKPLRARIVRRYLLERGVPWNRENLRLLETLAAPGASPSASCDVGGGRRLCRRYGLIRLEEEKKESFPPLSVSLTREGEYRLMPGIRVRVTFGPFPGKEKADKNTLYLSSKEERALLRPRVVGDVFWGKEGKKTLKKLMIDRRIPREDRARIPVAEIGGQVAGVMGEGASAPFFAKAAGDSVVMIVFIHETEEK